LFAAGEERKELSGKERKRQLEVKRK